MFDPVPAQDFVLVETKNFTPLLVDKRDLSLYVQGHDHHAYHVKIFLRARTFSIYFCLRPHVVCHVAQQNEIAGEFTLSVPDPVAAQIKVTFAGPGANDNPLDNFTASIEQGLDCRVIWEQVARLLANQVRARTGHDP